MRQAKAPQYIVTLPFPTLGSRGGALKVHLKLCCPGLFLEAWLLLTHW